MSWIRNLLGYGLNVQQQAAKEVKDRPYGTSHASAFQRVEPIVRQPSQSRVIQGVIGHTPSTNDQSGSIHSKKRSLGDSHNKTRPSKRLKYSDDTSTHDQPIQTAVKTHSGSRKRQRSPTCDNESTSLKRARPDLANDNVEVPPIRKETDASIVLSNETPNPEHVSAELEPTTTADDPDSFVDDDKFDETSLGEPCSVPATPESLLDQEVAGTTDSAIFDSGEDVDSTRARGSVETLERRLAGIKRNIESTAYASHSLQPDFINPPCPSGRLVGVGLWPESNHVPGRSKLHYNEPDVIELPTSRLRSLRKNSAVSIRALEPKHYLERKVVDKLLLPPLYKTRDSKSGKKKIASSHVKLTGVWNRSVGSSMGPNTWTE